MVSETEYFGGIDNIRWIWSTWTLPFNISIRLHSHKCRIISRMDFPISPFRILNRYLGYHTSWYMHCHTACDHFLNCFNEYLLLISMVTPTLILRRRFLSVNH